MHDQNHEREAAVAAGPGWRRIHHSPVFWVGIALCLAAILIYVWSDDLSWRPYIR